MSKAKINGFQKKTILRALDQPDRFTPTELEFCRVIHHGGRDYQVSDLENKTINKIGNKLR